MAKNYSISEAVEIIAKGQDMESIADIGRRYPVMAHKIAVVAAKAGKEFIDFMSFMPEYLSANKVNTAIKKVVEGGETESDEDADEAKTTEVTEDEADQKQKDDQVDWNEGMSAKQLWDILGKAGKRKEAKSTKKADLIEACKKVFGTPITEDADEDKAEATKNPYDGKSAVELFKECKKRGIKAPAKKTAKFYADLLVKDDAKADESNEDDEWDDKDESKEETPQKEKKAPAKKPVKKAVAKDEDEDDDWDI